MMAQRMGSLPRYSADLGTLYCLLAGGLVITVGGGDFDYFCYVPIF